MITILIMNNTQKLILSLVVVFIIINIFLVPIIGLRNLSSSNYFPYLSGYLSAVLFLIVAVLFFKKKR